MNGVCNNMEKDQNDAIIRSFLMNLKIFGCIVIPILNM